MQFNDYDPGLLLRTDEDIADYVQAAFEDEDPGVFIIALRDVIKLKGIDQVL